MNKIAFLLFFISFFAVAQPKISYQVYYQQGLEENGLKIKAQYVHEKESDSTVFCYANNLWGEDSLFKSLVVLKEENPGMTIRLEPEQGLIRVFHKRSKAISLTYRIKQDYKVPDVNITSRPQVRKEYFHILGQSLFAVPVHFTEPPFDREIEVNIDWLDFPEGFVIHNTFASGEKKQTIHTVLWDGFYSSLFVGGDYRVKRFDYHGKPVYFAVRDHWLAGYTDEFLFSNFENAVKSQRDFWKDYSQNYFTLILTPSVSRSDSLIKKTASVGSAIHNGFMIQAANNPFNDKDVYLYTLHHELMHEWIGHKIRNKYKQLNYWFSEGFTDYYTYKNRLRIKNISQGEWLRSFNEDVIKAHWKNPEKNIPNYTVKDSFWISRNVEKVPYRRGAIFAFWLDNQILLKSNYTKSLDNLMGDLLKRCKENKLELSDELVIDMANDYLDKDIAYFFQKHMINGEDIDLVQEKWAEGFTFKADKGIPHLELTNDKVKYILE